MESAKIVPDFIDKAPKNTLKVTYPSGVSVNFGAELTPTQVKDAPSVSWEFDDNKSLYTLLFTDLDAGVATEVRHWLVINIPGNNIAQGQTVHEYMGSGPPEGSGLHRYVFFVFKQKNKIVTSEFVSKSSVEGRLKTSTRAFITQYDLGNPIAGNFYLAQYDDYVPILFKQIQG